MLRGAIMAADVSGLFDFDERLVELSSQSDDLEQLNAVVDFEMFRPALKAAVPRADRSKGGRPPFDAVLMFKVLILQTMHSLSDERTEYLIKDRLSFMRFLDQALSHDVLDTSTICTFREALKKAHAVEALFARFDEALRTGGFLAMRDQIVDATIVAAPKQRNTKDEKQAIKEERIPAPGRVSRRRLRKWTATDAAAHDGARLSDVLDAANTAGDIWADTAYRSAKNETANLAYNMRRSVWLHARAATA
jgi:IS5 family transposase